MAPKTALSVIIISYNTCEITDECLTRLVSALGQFEKATHLGAEVILLDNNSSDGTVHMVKKRHPWVKLIASKENTGFAKGNNIARKYIEHKFVLFLNTVTIVISGVLDSCVSYMKQDDAIGALTCKLVMANGELDKDARRSFPTPWVSLTHFSGLDRLFPASELFARYWYGYVSPDKIHEVDVLQGAFFLTRKKVLDEVGWVQEVIINQRTGNLIDGHLRCQLAAREGAKTIPVKYVDLSEEEEALILSTLDPIAGMAATDRAKLDDLIRGIQSDNEQVQALVSEIAEKEGIIPPDFEPVGIDEQGRLDQKKPIICPECGHEFTP